MGEVHFYSGGTAGNRDGSLVSEDNSNSNPFNFGTLAINQESTVQTLAFRAGLGRQTQVPPVFKGDPHFNWSLDGVTFAGYGVDLAYNSVIGDTNKLIWLKVKALPGDSGQISPQMIIDAVQNMINIPPAPSLSVPVIAASSPAYNVLRVNTPTPAYSNIGATVTYEDYADGVLIGSSTNLVRDYNILAGTYSINTIAKDITNNLQQVSNTVTGVSVVNPPVNQAPVISAPVVYSLGQTSVILQYTASDDAGITAHQYSLGGVYFSDGVIENIGGGQYRLTISNLVAGTSYPNVTVKVLDAAGLSAVGTVSGGFTTSSAPANTVPTFSLNPRIKAGSIIYNAGTYTFKIEFGLNTKNPGVLADVDGDVITVGRTLGNSPYSPPDANYLTIPPTYNSSTGLWEISESGQSAGIYDYWVRLEDPTHTGVNGTHAKATITVDIAPTLSIGTPIPSTTSVQIPYTETDETGAINTVELSINGGVSWNTATSITGTYPNFILTVLGLASNTTYTGFQIRIGDAQGVKTTVNVPSFTTITDYLPTISSISGSSSSTTALSISGGYADTDGENVTQVDWFISTDNTLTGDLSAQYTSAVNKGSISGTDINTSAKTFSKAVTLGVALVDGTAYYLYARAKDPSGTGTAWSKSNVFYPTNVRLTDNFNDNSFDTNKWNTEALPSGVDAGTGVFEQNGQLQFIINQSANGLWSVLRTNTAKYWQFGNGLSGSVDMVNPPDKSGVGTTIQTFAITNTLVNNYILFNLNNARAELIVCVNGTETTVWTDSVPNNYVNKTSSIKVDLTATTVTLSINGVQKYSAAHGITAITSTTNMRAFMRSVNAINQNVGHIFDNFSLNAL